MSQNPVDTALTDEELEVLLRTGPQLAAYVAKAYRSLRERVAVAERASDEAHEQLAACHRVCVKRYETAEAEVERIKQVLTERELRAEVEWLKEREKTIKAESAERERIAKELTSFGIEFFSCASYAEMLRKGIAMVPVSVPSGAIQAKTYPAGPAMETFTMDQDAEDEENIELQQMRRNWQAAVERADMAAADYWEEHDRCGRLSQALYDLLSWLDGTTPALTYLIRRLPDGGAGVQKSVEAARAALDLIARSKGGGDE